LSQFYKSEIVFKTRTLSNGESSVDLHYKSFRWAEHSRASPVN